MEKENKTLGTERCKNIDIICIYTQATGTILSEILPVLHRITNKLPGDSSNMLYYSDTVLFTTHI